MQISRDVCSFLPPEALLRFLNSITKHFPWAEFGTKVFTSDFYTSCFSKCSGCFFVGDHEGAPERSEV